MTYQLISTSGNEIGTVRAAKANDGKGMLAIAQIGDCEIVCRVTRGYDEEFDVFPIAAFVGGQPAPDEIRQYGRFNLFSRAIGLAVAGASHADGVIDQARYDAFTAATAPAEFTPLED